ncbi:hypothetical protein BTN83_08020 [Klebsiella pneumoniae]|nr:hypothetical protein BTN83_08020 [Klebsiella pneumoniae]
MNSFLHQASFATGYWCYDRHRSVRLVVLVGLAIDQIAQSGLSSLSVIYYSAQLFRLDNACWPEGFRECSAELRCSRFSSGRYHHVAHTSGMV